MARGAREEAMKSRAEMKQGETEASTHTEKLYIRPHTFMHGEMCKLFYPNYYYSILAEI